MKAIILCGIVACIASAASAQEKGPVEKDPVVLLTNELKSQTPAQWEVRVRWREGDQLLATITPWPYQEAFDLWYDPSRLFEKLSSLCPKADDPVWSIMTPQQDVVLEPTVGGKTGVEARVSCRKLSSAVR
jgi:hypothetical protein